MRCVTGGLEAIRVRMRVTNMPKQEALIISLHRQSEKRDAAAVFEDYEEEEFNGETGHELMNLQT